MGREPLQWAFVSVSDKMRILHAAVERSFGITLFEIRVKWFLLAEAVFELR